MVGLCLFWCLYRIQAAQKTGSVVKLDQTKFRGDCMKK